MRVCVCVHNRNIFVWVCVCVCVCVCVVEVVKDRMTHCPMYVLSLSEMLPLTFCLTRPTPTSLSLFQALMRMPSSTSCVTDQIHSAWKSAPCTKPCLERYGLIRTVFLCTDTFCFCWLYQIDTFSDHTRSFSDHAREKRSVIIPDLSAIMPERRLVIIPDLSAITPNRYIQWSHQTDTFFDHTRLICPDWSSNHIK